MLSPSLFLSPSLSPVAVAIVSDCCLIVVGVAIAVSVALPSPCRRRRRHPQSTLLFSSPSPSPSPLPPFLLQPSLVDCCLIVVVVAITVTVAVAIAVAAAAIAATRCHLRYFCRRRLPRRRHNRLGLVWLLVS
jgi:hypothetical protein